MSGLGKSKLIKGVHKMIVISWFITGLLSLWKGGIWIPRVIQGMKPIPRRVARLVSTIVSGAHIYLAVFLAERLLNEVILDINLMTFNGVGSFFITLFGFLSLIVSLLSLVGAINNLRWKSF